MPIDKDRPSAEAIQRLRQRFPTEAPIDAVLTRKMRLRGGPGYSAISLERLVAGVESLLRAELDAPFQLGGARWLSGGASKLQMAFDLDWEPPGEPRRSTALVLRMEPAESLAATSRLREFQLVRAFEGVVPVPKAYWCDAEGAHLPYPALIYGFCPGVAKPTNASGRVSGTGVHLPPVLREALSPQFVQHLAAIHRREVHSAGLSAFEVPQPGTQCALWSVNWWDRVWEEDGGEEIPLLRVASAWLRRNLPVLDQPVAVHADYRFGNFLFTEHDSKISAVLDWELGRIGDRHQDLAWTTARALGTMDDDGKTFLVCGLMPEAEFLERYQQAAGVAIDRKTLHWYKVFNNFWLAILIIGTGYRIARLGKTHQDVLVTWLIGIGYVVLDQMRGQIEEAG